MSAGGGRGLCEGRCWGVGPAGVSFLVGADMCARQEACWIELGREGWRFVTGRDNDDGCHPLLLLHVSFTWFFW